MACSPRGIRFVLLNDGQGTLLHKYVNLLNTIRL